jgi:hypothetical protein
MCDEPDPLDLINPTLPYSRRARTADDWAKELQDFGLPMTSLVIRRRARKLAIGFYIKRKLYLTPDMIREVMSMPLQRRLEKSAAQAAANPEMTPSRAYKRALERLEAGRKTKPKKR